MKSSDHATILALTNHMTAITDRGSPVYLRLLSCLQLPILAEISQAILRDAQDEDERQIGLLLDELDHSQLWVAVSRVSPQPEFTPF